MGDALAGATLLAVLLLNPAIPLLLGWRNLRAGRYERADTLATITAVAALASFVLAGFLAFIVILVGGRHPAGMAIVTFPAAVWFLSRVLHRAVFVRRREAIQERRTEDRDVPGRGK